MRRKVIRFLLQLLYDFFEAFSDDKERKSVLFVYSKNSEKFGNLPLLYSTLKDDQSVIKIDEKVSFRNIYLMSKARVVCVDQATVLLSNLRLNKNKIEVIQVWHAGGAYKQVAFDAYDGTAKDFARILRIHGNTTKIIVSDEKLVDIYANAFKLHKEDVFPLGLIRSDLYHCHCCCENTGRFILYAPTFRTDKFGKRTLGDLFEKLKKINQSIKEHGDKLAVRLHPSLCDINLDDLDVENWSMLPLQECLEKTHTLITDYSSIFFDFSLFDGCIFWYVEDIEYYVSQQSRLYFNPVKKFPDYCALTVEELIDKLYSPHNSNCSIVRSEFMSACTGNSCSNVIELINKLR